MPQVFHKSMNTMARAGVIVVPLLLAGLTWGGLVYTRSPAGTRIGIPVIQPIPFSHHHHAGMIGIDCRYCHTSVETSAFAGIPPTETCMNCHSQIWADSVMLAPVYRSYASGESIEWRRVNNLPGFTYFEHSIHVKQGIGCSSCHGRIDLMDYTTQTSTLLMEWCLDCHRNPERAIRPRSEVFNMNYEPSKNSLESRLELVKKSQIRDPIELTSCSICHR